jgi:hypothetical protein
MPILGWDKAKKDALKILGDKGKVPDPPDSVEKSLTEFEKVIAAVLKAFDEVSDKLVQIENTNDAARNALNEFANKIGRDDLGLDHRDKEDAPKIAKAQKILSDWSDGTARDLSRNDKVIDDAEKTLNQLAKKFS